ncbi:hypothetical protein [Halomonas dongshanensis]|nr:hypothetical protein [Halomonas dongshanensis]
MAKRLLGSWQRLIARACSASHAPNGASAFGPRDIVDWLDAP